MRVASATITRPNDTTQYAAGEVMTGTVAAVLQFGVNSMFGEIKSALLVDSIIAGGTKPECDLLLYSESPDIAADNAAFAPTDAQSATLVASIPFLAANFKSATGNGHIVSANASGIPYTAPDRVLYGVLIARNTYVPTALEVFTLKLGVSD